MTPQELDEHKKEFKQISWLKSQIALNENYVRQLTRFDKNGSHRLAIIKAIENLTDNRKKFKEALNGRDYDQLMKDLQKATQLSKRKDKTAFNQFSL